MPKTHSVGVVVGRFQVHKLHEGHLGLIRYALDRCTRVIVFVGNSPLKNSTANPLDFRSREQMIRSAFWNMRDRLTILYINDTGDNESWAADLDDQIEKNVTFMELGNVMLFGSRDSFIPAYHDGDGIHDTSLFDALPVDSGTDIRRLIAASDARDSEDWRAALIYASQDRFPTSFQCIDITARRRLKWNGATGTEPCDEMLFGRKKHDKLLRFFGGFVDPTDASLEAAARREIAEEAGGIAVDGLKYLGSARVDDWRYDKEPDGIMSALFVSTFQFGHPTPTDDLKGGEVKWVPVDELKPTMFVPQHRHLLDLLLTKGI